MADTTTIPFIEMRKFYHQEIHCPFCGKDPERDMRDGGDFAPCEHTLLAAHSEFWIYLSDRAEQSLSANGIASERNDGDVMFTKPDDEEVDYDDVFAAIEADEAGGFHRIVGPPAMESSWVAFSPVSE